MGIFVVSRMDKCMPKTKVSIHERNRKHEMDVLDMAAMSKTWEQFAFSCEIANISDYFAANLVVPDEICLSDGLMLFAGLVQTHISATRSNYNIYRDTKSMRHKMYVNSNRKKKIILREGEKNLTIFYLGKKVIFNPQYGFAEFMVGRCG